LFTSSDTNSTKKRAIILTVACRTLCLCSGAEELHIVQNVTGPAYSQARILAVWRFLLLEFFASVTLLPSNLMYIIPVSTHLACYLDCYFAYEGFSRAPSAHYGLLPRFWFSAIALMLWICVQRTPTPSRTGKAARPHLLKCLTEWAMHWQSCT
jgi:hypothetical protein